MWCSARCRVAAARGGTTDPQPLLLPDEGPPTTTTDAGAGLEEWLDGREVDLPSSLVSAGRALARQVDEHPGGARLWGQYRGVLEALGDADADARGVVDVEAEDFVYQLATIAEAETERTRRYREADIDAERARWARLVPVGCAKGEHARLDRPGGAASCPDCGALFADDGWGEIPTEPITTTNKETYQ